MVDISCLLMKIIPRTGYTLLNSPGSTFIHSGEDLEQQQEAIMILANNGDIHLKAANGKIKLEALDIELLLMVMHHKVLFGQTHMRP